MPSPEAEACASRECMELRVWRDELRDLEAGADEWARYARSLEHRLRAESLRALEAEREACRLQLLLETAAPQPPRATTDSAEAEQTGVQPPRDGGGDWRGGVPGGASESSRESTGSLRPRPISRLPSAADSEEPSCPGSPAGGEGAAAHPAWDGIDYEEYEAYEAYEPFQVGADVHVEEERGPAKEAPALLSWLQQQQRSITDTVAAAAERLLPLPTTTETTGFTHSTSVVHAARSSQGPFQVPPASELDAASPAACATRERSPDIVATPPEGICWRHAAALEGLPQPSSSRPSPLEQLRQQESQRKASSSAYGAGMDAANSLFSGLGLAKLLDD
ncbi:hypothetical protein AB1Y20_018939 [Prymnesium parvum]|uniref:Uncharacterized protein n=1 Tax=Prymnesium parvum TaxID=97485 RepID=A0AB34JQ17_PRYPA